MEQETVFRTAELILGYLKVLAWPTSILVGLWLVRPTLVALVGGSKVTVSLFGVEVESTLPELEAATTEYVGGTLSKEQLSFLQELFEEGERSYESSGISSAERKKVRPLRNAGLIMTVPTGSYLSKAEALRLTALGEFLMRHRTKQGV